MEEKIATLADLKIDKKNARKHNPRNIGMIETSLRRVGAARSGVIDENGTILAGNGTYEALANAGIERVRVVETDGNEWVVVKRTGLTEEQKRELALADNRAAELATWDAPALLDQGVDLKPWFSLAELAILQEEAEEHPLGNAPTDRQLGEKEKQIKVVLYVDELGPFEQAIRATGDMNRGSALVSICKEYLAHHAKG